MGARRCGRRQRPRFGGAVLRPAAVGGFFYQSLTDRFFPAAVRACDREIILGALIRIFHRAGRRGATAADRLLVRPQPEPTSARGQRGIDDQGGLLCVKIWPPRRESDIGCSAIKEVARPAMDLRRGTEGGKEFR